MVTLDTLETQVTLRHPTGLLGQYETLEILLVLDVPEAEVTLSTL